MGIGDYENAILTLEKGNVGVRGEMKDFLMDFKSTKNKKGRIP